MAATGQTTLARRGEDFVQAHSADAVDFLLMAATTAAVAAAVTAVTATASVTAA